MRPRNPLGALDPKGPPKAPPNLHHPEGVPAMLTAGGWKRCHPVLPPGTCKCYLIRKKGLCRHGEVDDPDMEILPWIIWVGSKSNQKCAYKEEAEGEGSVQRTPGLERWPEPRNAISNQAPCESAQILPSASRGLPDNTLMRDQ